MKNAIFIQSIQNTLNAVGAKLTGSQTALNLDQFKSIKTKLSASVMASKMGINEQMLHEFEQALRQFFTHRENESRSRLACFRISLWLETVSKKMSIPFEFEKALNDEEIAIKQIRAFELILRDFITEQLGGNESVISKLKGFIKDEVISKWINSADQSGILSGTTFSEMSNILLDKNIFKGIEEIFESSNILITKSSRESLRYILEDIRVIRNAIAHNKKISNIQIEALNEYYISITEILKHAQNTKIDPDKYLDLTKAKIEEYISSLKEDHNNISGQLEDIKSGMDDLKTDSKEIKKDSSTTRKRSFYISVGVGLLILIGGLTLYLQYSQNRNLKDVNKIIKGDSEIKNMSSSDDLSATKDLNARTKDKNAKRLAILYFDNSSGDPALNKLKKGLADMMITDLSNIHMLAIVERDKLESILTEQKLSNSKAFDPSTASKLGKLLGAQIILTGGYFEMYGSLRLDARFIDVETGRILKSDGVEGEISNFFKMQKQLSWKIINTLDIKLSESEKKSLENNEKSKALSFEDAKKYSNALDHFDEGNTVKAKTALQEILKVYPDFEAANNLLARIK